MSIYTSLEELQSPLLLLESKYRGQRTLWMWHQSQDPQSCYKGFQMSKLISKRVQSIWLWLQCPQIGLLLVIPKTKFPCYPLWFQARIFQQSELFLRSRQSPFEISWFLSDLLKLRMPPLSICSSQARLYWESHSHIGWSMSLLDNHESHHLKFLASVWVLQETRLKALRWRLEYLIASRESKQSFAWSLIYL